jgi:hypothetical protein
LHIVRSNIMLSNAVNTTTSVQSARDITHNAQ